MAFRKRVEDTGNVFTWEILFGYYAVRLLTDAFERAGTADKAKVVPALAASTYYPDMLPYAPTRFVNGQNQGAQASGLADPEGRHQGDLAGCISPTPSRSSKTRRPERDLPPVDILAAALVNGLLTGGVYALVALGLTLIYGVLHIVNFAHGSLLMLAMFGAWLLVVNGGLDPYAGAAAADGDRLRRRLGAVCGRDRADFRRRRPPHPAGHAGCRGGVGQPGACGLHRRYAHDRHALRLRGGGGRAAAAFRAETDLLRGRARAGSGDVGRS